MSVEFAPDVAAPVIPVIPARVLDEAVLRAVLGRFGRRGGRDAGGFVSALLDAFVAADAENYARLEASFPVEGYWVRVLREPGGVTVAVRAADMLGVRLDA